MKQTKVRIKSTGKVISVKPWSETEVIDSCGNMYARAHVEVLEIVQ